MPPAAVIDWLMSITSSAVAPPERRTLPTPEIAFVTVSVVAALLLESTLTLRSPPPSAIVPLRFAALVADTVSP